VDAGLPRRVCQVTLCSNVEYDEKFRPWKLNLANHAGELEVQRFAPDGTPALTMVNQTTLVSTDFSVGTDGTLTTTETEVEDGRQTSKMVSKITKYGEPLTGTWTAADGQERTLYSAQNNP
jgi:hypothetical protein